MIKIPHGELLKFCMPNENYSLGGAASQNKPHFFLVLAQLSTDKRNSRQLLFCSLQKNSAHWIRVGETESALILNVLASVYKQNTPRAHREQCACEFERVLCFSGADCPGRQPRRTQLLTRLPTSVTKSWSERFHFEDKLLLPGAQNLVCHFARSARNIYALGEKLEQWWVEGNFQIMKSGWVRGVKRRENSRHANSHLVLNATALRSLKLALVWRRAYFGYMRHSEWYLKSSSSLIMYFDGKRNFEMCFCFRGEISTAEKWVLGHKWNYELCLSHLFWIEMVIN